MSWQRILENDRPAESLRQRIDALFAQQRATWPALRDGEAALEQLERKTLVAGGESVIVQVNPARRRSTLAKTDAKAVAERPCFLCPDNMPIEERGVAFEDLVVLPNPFPILRMHCTIAGREHRPQRLGGRVESFLRLAWEIGPDLAALYNGPRCGASAPDHFHFQAAWADEIPILAQLPPVGGGREVVAHSSFSRNMLVFGGTNESEVAAAIDRAIAALGKIEAAADEPMLNLIARFHDGRWTVVLFPRAVHRPACYFATGEDRLAVSPAVLEMGGILVTTEPGDYERIDAGIARAIYEEVTIGTTIFEQLVAESLEKR